MKQSAGVGITPREVFRLTDFQDRQLVQSGADLCDLLTAALRKYEAELHGEQSPVRSLWDRQGGGKTFRPVEEDSLSDHVSLFLRRELVYGEKLGSLCKEPMHDWASHAADAFRTAAVMIREPKRKEEKEKRKSVSRLSPWN